MTDDERRAEDEVGDARAQPLDDAAAADPRRGRGACGCSIASAACCSGMSTYGTTRGWLASSSIERVVIVSGYR